MHDVSFCRNFGIVIPSIISQGLLGTKAVSYTHLDVYKRQVQLVENVEPDPSVETVMRGAEAMREFQPDWIISMGGGSPIDAAKAMWVFYEYPEDVYKRQAAGLTAN